MTDEVIAGRYRLDKRLGAGGMAEVWAAHDLDLDRTVAVKLLAPHADRQRFEREARAAAALSHPNICVLYSYGETGDRPFMVLEYLPGGSLEDRLAPGRPLRDADAQRIALEIAAGLAHAHERGLVHRDLKPSNVLFDAEGRAKIADFGIARLGELEGLTAVGTVLGTAAYISPEQAAGGEVTPASDVYAFGVILYRMLTGRLPFESKDALEMVALHRDEPPPLATIRPGAPARLESVAMAALSKSPLDRPRDGVALLAELEAGASPPGETEATQVLRPPPAGRTRTAVVLLVAALLAAGGVALALAVTFGDGTSSTPPSTSLPASRPATPGTTAPVAPPPTPAPATSTKATTSEPATTAAPEPTTVPTTAPVPTTVPPTTAPVPPPPPPPPPVTTAPPATTETPTTDTTVTDTGTTATTATPVAPG